MALPSPESHGGERSRSGLGRVLGAGAAALLCAALVVMVGVQSTYSGTELDSVVKSNVKNAKGDTSIAVLQKNVAKLTWLLSSASREAEQAEEQEQLAKSQLDTSKSYIGSEELREKKKHELGAERNALEKEQALKQAYLKASSEAETEEKKSKLLQKQLDAKVNMLAMAQINLHDSSENMDDTVENTHVTDHAALPPHVASVAGKAKPAAKKVTVEDLEKKVAALTSALEDLVQMTKAKGGDLSDVAAHLLQMPLVQKAITQSLNDEEVKIAQGIAASLNKEFSTGDPVDPKIEAEVAVAQAEQETPPKPEVNMPEVDEAIKAGIDQARREIEIEKNKGVNSTKAG